jgi:hypothetical protein
MKQKVNLIYSLRSAHHWLKVLLGLGLERSVFFRVVEKSMEMKLPMNLIKYILAG